MLKTFKLYMSKNVEQMSEYVFYASGKQIDTKYDGSCFNLNEVYDKKKKKSDAVIACGKLKLRFGYDS